MTHANIEHGTPISDNDQVMQVTEQLRQLNAYGPVTIATRSEGYTTERGERPLHFEPDQRCRFWLGHTVLTVTDDEDGIRVAVAAPEGERVLPLGEIEEVTVDHPLHRDMPLHGKRMMALALYPWGGHENVIRWVPRAIDRSDGSHRRSVFETELDPANPAVGVVRAYDISTPWNARTSLEVAKEAQRPYGLYLVSVLGSAGVQSGLETEGSITVITSRMGYTDSDRTVTVLPPQDYSLPERTVTMLDVADRQDAAVYEAHLVRLGVLSTEYGVRPEPVTQFQVDDAFLYATHD